MNGTISRRKALLGVSAGVIALATGCTAFPRGAPDVSAGSKARARRILFIAVDDLRPMLGHYGAMAKTPNLDALAAGAVTFDNAYVQVAVCGASRASLFTALRPETTGMVTYRERIEKTVPKAPSLHGSFKAAGFRTFSYGKTLHFADDTLGGWSEPPVTMPQDRAPGIDPKMQLTDSALDPASDAIWRADTAKYGEVRRQPAYEAADVPDTAYRDGKLVDRAIERLDRLAKTDDPFLFMLGIYKPHLPFNAPKKYWDLYDRAKIPLPDRGKLSDGAPTYAVAKPGEISVYSGLPPMGDRFSDDDTRALIHGYMACVSYIDAMIGKLIARLKSNGLWDDLTVCLWGDHGYKLGDYTAWAKHGNFEIDTRVPLILRVPGLADKGSRTDALVETVDLFPTLLDLAGIAIPGTLEGRSFVPLLERPDRSWKSAVFSQYPRTVKGVDLMGYTVRTRQYRYTAWKEVASGKTLSRELYDHRQDRLEMRSLADDPAMAKTVADLDRLRTLGWRAVP